MSVYPKEQQIYSLSWLSNSAGGIKAPSMKSLQNYVTEVTTKVLKGSTTTPFLGTKWTTVWGPVVWANDTTADKVHADNTMGLFYNTESKLYVIAIAGTNPDSPFGWLKEDLAIGKRKMWKELSPNAKCDDKANVSQGTATGLGILLNKMTETKDQKTMSMEQALKAHASGTGGGGEVAVTGHSLGGALTPPLALYLKNQLDAEQLPNKITKISAYPTAGPTSGNVAFANYYHSLVEAGKFEFHGSYNTLDPVGYVWHKIGEIPQLYKDKIKSDEVKPNAPVIGLIALGLGMNMFIASANMKSVPPTFSWRKRDDYAPIPGLDPLTGSFNGTVDDGLTNWVIGTPGGYFGLGVAFKQEVGMPKDLEVYWPVLTNLARFAIQAVFQHTDAYSKHGRSRTDKSLLQIGDFTEKYKEIKKGTKPKKFVVKDEYTAVMGEMFTEFNVEDEENVLDFDGFSQLNMQEEMDAAK